MTAPLQLPKAPRNEGRRLQWPWVLLLFLLLSPAVQAQWKTTTYTLKGGWNAIYLNGDATQDTIDNLLPSQVTQVWRWNPNPTAVQFTSTPLIPSAGTAEWSVWIRGQPLNSTLTQLTGQTSYLVNCAGTTLNTYSVPLKQAVLPPSNNWVINGANLMGFPSLLSGSYPLFSNYFASFPAAIAANTKIYKYVGGDLGPGNPLQVFSPGLERLDRTQAYWFSSQVAGNFSGPLTISLSTNGGLAFSRTGTAVAAYVHNNTSAAVTLTLSPVASEAAPASQTGFTAAVPLTSRVYNASTLAWTETPITAPFTVVIGPGASSELDFGINRADPSMTGAAVGALFGSFLRITDSSLMDVYLPATAQQAALSGLWMGDISVTNVGSQVSNPAHASATVSGGVVTSVAVSGSGGYGYTSAPTVTIDDPASGTTATATATVSNGSVTSFAINNGGSGYAIASPKVTISPPPPLAGTSTPSPFALRTLLHVGDDGVARLLSNVYLGQLAVAPHSVGICTRQSLLNPAALASAQRFVAAHLPLDQVITSSSGSVVLPGVITFTVTILYNDATNPFLHQYHPDHDNRDAQFNPISLNGKTATTVTMADGVEAPAITRTCTFTFTSTPPAGSTTTSGWGSSVIGGTYSETISGIHKQTLQVSGIFQLQRASQIGSIQTQ